MQTAMRWIAAGVTVILVACGSATDTTVGVAEPASSVVHAAHVERTSTTLGPAPAFTKIADVDYGPRRLDVYAPDEAENAPVVVIIHGFGEYRGAYRRLAEALASHGVLTFNVDALMADPFLTAVEQIACAVRYARATASEYGGDAARIALVGNSAGAATGAVAALAGDSYGGECLAKGSALPDALIAYEGPYDWATHSYGTINLVALQAQEAETWQAIDPYAQVGGNPGLRVRLIHGNDVDTAWYDIPDEVAAEFYRTLEAAGYDVQLTVLDGATHLDLPRSDSEAFAVAVEQVLESLAP